MTKNYYIDLFKVVCENMFNDHANNYDYLRFGPEIKSRSTLMGWFRKRLNKRGYFNRFELDSFSKSLSDKSWVEDFEYLYNVLDDTYSKNLLLQIVTYRMMGYRKVRLPLSTNKHWETIAEFEKEEKKDDFIETGFMNLKLYYLDLSFINIPIRFYFTGAGVYIDFVIKQYDFNRDNIKINVSEGDVVIDGGGCWGDTALYFAYKTGIKGSVHSFEFIPDNIEIWKKNVELNKEFQDVIFLAPNPLWSSSKMDVFFKENGPGSKVSFEKFDGYDGVAHTVAIDDYVKNNNLSKVDFIKLDIEGAELSALEGAIETLRTFKPKLSIALYHNVKDFYTIPKFLDSLNLGYKFYLSHSTIHEEETMLFATFI